MITPFCSSVESFKNADKDLDGKIHEAFVGLHRAIPDHIPHCYRQRRR
jgi:hypothetical protein